MADSELWGPDFALIGAPAATDRMPLATGPGAGGYSERGEFIWRDAAGNFQCSGPLLINRAGWSGLGKLNVEGGADFTGGNVHLCRDVGSVAVGGASGGARLHVKSFHEMMRLETTTARGGGDNYIQFNDSSGPAGYFGYSSANSSMEVWNNLDAPFNVYTNNLISLRVDSSSIRGGFDNLTSSGSASVRWTVVHAVTGTINTCDIRFKTFRADPTPSAAELRAALRAVDELGFFQWNDAIALRGPDEARWHFGPRAQAVWAIFAAEGLCAALVQREPGGDWLPPVGSIPPAFLCFDEWGEETAPVMAWWRPSDILDVDGQPIMVLCEEGEEGTEQRPTGETYVARPAGNRFGVRIDQLHSLMIAALNAERLSQAATIADLVTRVTALEPEA